MDAGFDEHDIPMDVIWLDIDHTDKKKYLVAQVKGAMVIFMFLRRYFTWDDGKFPSSVDMINGMAAKGRKVSVFVYCISLNIV